MASPADMETLRERLRPVLEPEAGWRVVYLFGSHARGTSGPLSDVDIGLLYGPGAALPSLLAQAGLAGRLAQALDVERVDVVLLDRAPVLLRHRVLRDGAVLFCRDDTMRVRFASISNLEYLDTEPLRHTLWGALSERIRSGQLLD